MHVCFHLKRGPRYVPESGALHFGVVGLPPASQLYVYELNIETLPLLTFAEEEMILAIHFPKNSSCLSLDESLSE